MVIQTNRRLAAEFLGTLFLLTIVVGSGIMGDRLSNGHQALALLANSIATGLGLSVLIMIFGPISGAHFNPVVTLISMTSGHHSKIESFLYICAQILGAICGVAVAHAMFEETFTLSIHAREGFAQCFSEFVATFGLIMVILGISKNHGERIPYAVGSYIASAYWFTSSTSFANPAVTIARAFTRTFAGIAPSGVMGFVLMQFLGAGTAAILFRWLNKESK